ncbi:MAG: hypothetical protein V4439_03700 [Patescibacteria group bacterium]
MKINTRTVIITLLVVIILIIGYVAFLKPQNIPAINTIVNNPVQNNSPVSTTLPQYMGTYENGWPPVVKDSSVAYSCLPSNGENSTAVQKIINGKTYCVSSFLDGAAGHVGGDYTYTKANGAGIKIATFKLYWVNCDGYGGPGNTQYDNCKTNQKTFFDNLDNLIDSLM